MLMTYSNFMIMDDKGLIGGKQGDIVTLARFYDKDHVLCIDKDNREILLKLTRLKTAWSCIKCHYTYDNRGNCKCLR